MKSLKKIILSETGFKSIPALKKHLKAIAKNEYGCFYAEIKKPTFKVSYTSNPNCFASYLVSINLPGMVNQLGLDAESITTAGRKRGCTNYYIK